MTWLFDRIFFLIPSVLRLKGTFFILCVFVLGEYASCFSICPNESFIQNLVFALKEYEKGSGSSSSLLLA